MSKKFKAIHLLSGVNEKRVRRSIKDVSQLHMFGIDYKQIHNELHNELPPRETCLRPHAVSMEPGGKNTEYGFEWNLTPRSYGCYLAHKYGVLENFDDDLDGLLVFECDAVCCIKLDDFFARLWELDDLCKEHKDIFFTTFGYRHNAKTLEKIEELEIVDRFYGTHAYYVPISSKKTLCNFFETKPWDTIDVFYTHHFAKNNLKAAIFNDRPIWVQADGVSYLQGNVEKFERYYRGLRYPERRS